MNAEYLRDYALQLPGVAECFPFGDSTLVFKLAGRIFLLVSLDEVPCRFNVKCDPAKALELREAYPGIVLPGYHMNKLHWNTVIVNGRLGEKEIREMIDHSYELIAMKAKKKK